MLAILFAYEGVYSALISYSSILIGAVVTCWIYFQANQYQIRREYKRVYNELCIKLDVFRHLLGKLYKCDIWKNKAAIEGYEHHSKVTRCADARKEVIMDNPVLNLYLATKRFDKAFQREREYYTCFEDFKLNEIQDLLIKIKNPDVWDDVADKNIWESLPDSLQEWLRDEYPIVGDKDEFSKKDAMFIVKEASKTLYAVKDVKSRIRKVWVPDFSKVLCITFITFVFSFIMPVIIIHFEIESLWVLMSCLIVALTLSVILWLQMKHLFHKEIDVR